MAINEITITEERSKVVDFSVPYFDANQGFLITKGGPAEGVQSIAEMKDLQFGFQAATTGGDYINDKIQPNEQPREFSSLGAAVQALANGQIDAFLMDVAIGSEIVKERGDEVAMPGQFVTNEQYGVLFEKGQPAQDQVNKAIEEIKADGTLERAAGQVVPRNRGPAGARVASGLTCPGSASGPRSSPGGAGRARSTPPAAARGAATR